MTTQRGVWRKSQVGCGDLLSIRKPSTVILVSPAWIYFICPHPSLPQIHTTPQRFQSRLYILTYFWGVGAQFLWGLPVFMNRKEYQKSPFIFRDQPQPVRRLVTQDAQWEDVCPDGSARQGGWEVCVVDDLCLLQADFNVGPAVDWSPSGLGSGELGGCGWHGHLISSLNVGASWAKYL